MSTFRPITSFIIAYLAVLAVVIVLTPDLVHANTVQCVNSYNGHQVRTYTLPPNTLNPGPNQHNSLSPNAAAAEKDIGKTFFTLELTSFNDAQCADGPCRNTVPGIAHRTWPLNSCVAVCDAQTKECAIAIVMDRGPNTQLRCRTIDANPALQAALGMKGGTIKAVYTLLSLPGKPCALGPSSRSNVDISGINVQSRSIPNAGNPGGYPVPISSLLGGGTQALGIGTGQGAYAGQPARASQTAYPSGGTQPQSGGQGGAIPIPSSGGQATYTGPAVATVIAQSDTVARGGYVTVSWSSIGMRTDRQCQLSMQPQSGVQENVAQGNEGNQSVRVPITAPTGTATFKLRCEPMTGSPIEKTDTIVIE